MKLGVYEIDKEVGRGGMGSVLRGRAPDGKPVAIKLLLKPGSSAALARFDRERRLLSELAVAQGFVPILDAGTSSQGPYLVMPFLDGGTLRDRLDQGALPVETARRLGESLARSLGRAHAIGIVHRDLKPENVLFESHSPDAAPLIADLGLAKHFELSDSPALSAELTKTGESTGTAGYMAPEQMNDSKAVGPPSDVFSLAAIIYECLTGEEAFGGDSAHVRFAAVAAGRYEPVRRKRPETPRWLAAVVESALAADPDDRYEDGSAFAEALSSPGSRPGAATRLILPFVFLSGVALTLAIAFAVARRTRAISPMRPPRATPSTEPSLAPSPREPVIPAFAKPLRESRRTKLSLVIGDFGWKQEALVEAVAFTPGEDRALTGAKSDVALWDLATGDRLRTFPVETTEIHGLEPSPDGSLVLVVGREGAAQIWELATGRLVTRLEGHQGQVYEGHFVDAAHVVTAGDDGTLRLWEIATGKPVWVKAKAHMCIFGCGVSRDGKRVATVGGDTDLEWHPDLTPEAKASTEKIYGFTTKIWDVATGEPLHSLVGHRQLGHGVAFSPDGSRLASSGWDCTVRVWDTNDGSLLRTLEGSTNAVRTVAFVEGGRVISGGGERLLRLWDPSRRKGEELVASMPAHRTACWKLAASRDGKRVLSCGDRTLRLWDVAAKKPVVPFMGHEGAVVAATFDLAKKQVVTAGNEASVRSWDLADGSPLELRDLEVPEPRLLALGRGGALSVSVSGNEGAISLVDEKGVRRLEGQKGKIAALACSRDGTRVVSAGQDGMLRFWDAVRGQQLAELSLGGIGHALAVSDDGSRAVVGYETGVVLWDRATPTGISGNAIESQAMSAVAISADGRRALAGSKDGSVWLWEIDTNAVSCVALAGKSPVAAIAASPAFGLAAASGADGSVRLFDLKLKEEIDRIEVSSVDDPTALAVASDEGPIVVGSKRGVVLVLDILPLSKSHK